MTQEELAQYLEALIRRASPFEDDAGRVFVTTDDGQRVELLGATVRVESRNTVRSRRANFREVAQLIGPVIGLNFYSANGPVVIQLREKNRQTVISGINEDEVSEVGYIDIDRGGKIYTLMPIFDNGGVNPAALHISRGPTTIRLTLPHSLAFSPWQIRTCNNWVWGFPERMGLFSEINGGAPQKGHTLDLLQVKSVEDIRYFDINITEELSLGALFGSPIGRFAMNGTVPMSPGGPTYPFSYDFNGEADGSRLYTYSSVPSPSTEPDPDSPGDVILTFEFPLGVTGIDTPTLLIFDSSTVIINLLGTGFTVSATWESGSTTITLRVRSILYGADWEPTEVSVRGDTENVQFLNGSVEAQYTLPMLLDIKSGLMIAERFNGEVRSRIQVGNQGLSAATANNNSWEESGTSETFFRAADGTEKAVDGYWQHVAGIHDSGLSRGQELTVGQTFTCNFKSSIPPKVINGDGLPIYLAGVPGSAMAFDAWREGFSFYDFLCRLTQNTPKAADDADFARKTAPGASVYGVYYPNSKGLTTVFKGKVVSFNYRTMNPGEYIFPRVTSFGYQAAMQSEAWYLVSSYAIEITEIINDVTSLTFDVFGDQYRGFEQADDSTPPILGFQAAFSGFIFLDGSIRNIWPTGRYNSSFIAQSFSLGSYTLAAGSYYHSFAGAHLIWEDPWIWRVPRDFGGVAEFDAEIIREGDRDRFLNLPRWRLDYSGPEVRCWFETIDRFKIMEPPEDNGEFYIYDCVNLTLDRAMILKQIKNEG